MSYLFCFRFNVRPAFSWFPVFEEVHQKRAGPVMGPHTHTHTLVLGAVRRCLSIMSAWIKPNNTSLVLSKHPSREFEVMRLMKKPHLTQNSLDCSMCSLCGRLTAQVGHKRCQQHTNFKQQSPDLEVEGGKCLFFFFKLHPLMHVASTPQNSA